MGRMWAVAALGARLLLPKPASACGGFFCNQGPGQAVNQAAESIIFANNGDGTTTAVIESQYEALAQAFSWFVAHLDRAEPVRASGGCVASRRGGESGALIAAFVFMAAVMRRRFRG